MKSLKVLMLNGSPHTNGNTAVALREMEAVFKENGVEAETVVLGNRAIRGCVACGACVKACPKGIIELRKRWPKHRAVYVSCVSKDKGAVVMKACKAGCIGCGKCVKVCAFDAIKVENNLAYIDPLKCKLCRKCVNECPTGAIRLVGMEPLPREPKAAPAAAVKPAPAKSADGESPKSE